MAITEKLKNALKGAIGAPVIIKTKRSTLGVLGDALEDRDIIGKRFETFSMFSTFLPKKFVDKIAGLDFVENIFLDMEMRIPEIKAGIDTTHLMRGGVRNLIKDRRRMLKSEERNEKIRIQTSDSRKVLGADIAEEIGITGRGIQIAVIDSDAGTRFRRHPQLRGKVMTKFLTPDKFDESGHGSHVATTAFGRKVEGPDEKVIEGVAPNAGGWGIKTLAGSLGIGSVSIILEGLEFAVLRGVDIINMSLGGSPQDEDPICEAIKEINRLLAHPPIIVVAAGNDGPDPNTIGSPGVCENVITIGSMTKEGFVSEFSSRGPTPDGRIKPDFIAPGEDVFSGVSRGTLMDFVDKPITGFSALSGTSMATPHFSGLVALIKEFYQRDIGVVPTTDTIMDMGRSLGARKNNNSGYGLLTFQKAQAHSRGGMV